MPNDRSRPVMFARQAAELDYALERNGCGPDFVKWLSTGNNLTSIRKIHLGQAEVRVRDHIIDLNAAPSNHHNWDVEYHKPGGCFIWNPARVQLYLSTEQRQAGSIKGSDLREKLANKPVFNGNLLDYLLANPYLIPARWKRAMRGRLPGISFWGTIYRTPVGGLFVRYLVWGSEGTWGSPKWHAGNDSINHGEWTVNRPVALCASI